MGYNAGGNLVAFGAPIIQQLSGGPAITAQVLPDNVNKALTVKVTWGLAAPLTARWVATVRNTDPVALNTALLSSTHFAFQQECGGVFGDSCG